VQVLGTRIVVAAFDGWNDAGEAASAAAEQIDDGGYARARGRSRAVLRLPVGPPDARTRPGGQSQPPLALGTDAAARRSPESTEPRLWLLTGTEPARPWQAFSAEFIDAALSEDITGFVTLGAMLSDVPHTRPISIFASSENAEVREALGIERSTYEGPIGILSALEHAAEEAGIPRCRSGPTCPITCRPAARPPRRRWPCWTDCTSDRGRRAARIAVDRSRHVGGDDRRRRRGGRGDGRLHRAARDEARHLGIPDASGEAIAQAFERFFRRNGEGPGEHKR
jgi:hypothetical protein